MNGGKIVVKTEVDTSGFKNGLDRMQNSAKGAGVSLKSIVAGLGITKLISMGFNAIRNSMDGAIQRIDTFNQYPKVLANFGVSADEASKSIKRIDKSVQGLPTSLDQAVGGVQNLFMVTKDLPKAEKLFKAVNDSAMVFAGGSTEAVDRFAYAFKQAMSSGKVSAQDFNQMNEAIPGLMDKVAESMGKTYRELKEGLSDGSISMEEFNDALLKLDTEGGAGMKALEQSAKSATGGIKTSLQNAKTAITRGVANMIEGLNKSLKKAKLGSITEIIAKAGKLFEKELSKISSMLSKIDFKKLINTFKTLAPAIMGVVSALIAYRTVLLVTKGINFAKTLIDIIKYFGVMVGAINSATISQNALNIAQSMSPVGMIIATVGALVTMVGVYKSLNPEVDKNASVTRQLANDYKKFSEELANNRKQRKENIDTATSETKYAEMLANRIESLASVENKSNYQKKEMARLVAELNEEMPNLNLQYDQEKDKLNMSTKAIQDNIKAQKELNIVKAYQKNLKGTAEDLAKAEMKLGEATKSKNKWEKDYLKAKRKVYELEHNYTQHELETNDKLIVQHAKWTSKLSEASYGYGKAKDNVKKYSSEVDKLSAEYDKTSEYADKFQRKADLKPLISQAEEAGIKIPKALKDNIIKGMYDVPTTLNELQNLINFDKALTKAGISGSDIPKRISSGVMSGQLTVQQAIDQANRWITFKKAVDDAGLSGQKIPEKVKQGILSGKMTPNQALDEMINNMKKKVKKDSPAIGENILVGTEQGAKNRKGTTGSLLNRIATDILSAFKSGLKEKSPSKATYQMALFLFEGFDIGAEKGSKKTVKNIGEYGSDIVDAFEKSTDMTSSINKMQKQMQSAVNIQQGKMSTNIQTGKVFNNLVATTPVNVNLNAGVELDGQKVGRLITPEVSRTIKSGGGV